MSRATAAHPAELHRTRTSRARTAIIVAVAATGLAAAGCAPADQAAAPTTAATSAACGRAELKTRTPGKLTVGTGEPAYSPWFVDDTPSNGKGFESAVAYAVAAELGYQPTDVAWSVVSFRQATSAGPKPFDVDVDEVFITAGRRKNLDFSSGYYDVVQAVVTTKGSKADGVRTLAGLRGLRLGARVGTPSYSQATALIAPTRKVAAFTTDDDATAALAKGQLDAIVVDLPTALHLAAAGAADGGIDRGVVVGQLPAGPGTPEQFGMVLDKGSPLTSCVTKIVDALRADGTLDELQQQWLTDSAGGPALS